MTLLPGDILLWRVTPNAPWKDRLIGWGESKIGQIGPQNMEYYHVAVVSPNPKRMYSAQPPKIALYPVPDPLPPNIEVKRFKTAPSADQWASMWAYANSRLGDWYDFIGVLTFGFIELGGLEFCSQLTEDWAAHGGILLCPNVKFTTPDNIALSSELVSA